MQELWEEIVGFPGYIVSNYGEVRNTRTDRKIRPRYNGKGYLHVALWVDGDRHDRYVHQLVAQAFFGGWTRGMQVRFVNGDKSNCRADNLSLRNGGRDYRGVDQRRESWGKRVRVVETGDVYRTARDAARYLGGDYSAIYACCRGDRRTHLGLHFEYA